MTDAKGAVTAYSYTPTGQIAREEDALGKVTTYEYDALDRVIKVVDGEHVTTYAYDALGNATKTVSPSGASTTLEYDALGRVTGSTDANGNKTSYVLDANGNVVQTIDALGNVAAYEYDAMNRLTKMTLHRVDPQDDVDEYEITLYEYDHNGLVTKTVNALGDEKLMVYDQNGNLVQQTDEDGLVTEYSYDAVNLVTAINYADGKTAAFTYDEAGNLTEMQDWTGKTTYELDLLDRITAMNDPNGKTVRYAFDATGQKAAVTYPDGTQATYAYDALGRMTAVTDAEGKTTSYTYNAHGWKTGMTYPNGWAEEYTYDSEGRMLSSIDIDPTDKEAKSPQYTYEYDPAGNLLHEFKRGNGTGAVKEDVTYTYDALNRLVKADELYGKQTRRYQYDSLGNLTFEQTGSNKTVDYKYNALNQLIAKTVDGKDNYRYTYDKRGNQLGEVYEKKNRQVSAAAYDASNRMVQGTNDLGEQSVYTFNGLGQLVQNTLTVKKNAYGYHDVQPDSIVDGTAVVEAETGKKQKKEKKPAEEVAASPALNKTSTVVKDFVIDATSPVQAPLTETEQGENGLTYRYTYGLERVSVQIGNVTTSAGGLVTEGDTVKLYYHTDRLGTYRYLTDDVKGKVTSWTDYDEWGNITHNAVLKMGQRQLDLVKNYTGHEYDSVLSLYYAKARMYDAGDKRFTQEDPAKDGLNWYVYCKDNPVAYVDIVGLEWIVVSGGIYSDESSHPGYAYNFIDPAMKKLQEMRASDSTETITWVIAKAGWTNDEIIMFIQIANDLDVEILFIDSADQLINYLNTKSASATSSITQARKDDKITKFVVFSHGLIGLLPLGFNYSKRNHNLDFEMEYIQKLSCAAFDSPNSWFYSCNTGTKVDGQPSFAEEWQKRVGGFTGAYAGTTSYYEINKDQDWTHKINFYTSGFYKGAKNYPKASDGVQQVTFGKR